MENPAESLEVRGRMVLIEYEVQSVHCAEGAVLCPGGEARR